MVNKIKIRQSNITIGFTFLCAVALLTSLTAISDESTPEILSRNNQSLSQMKVSSEDVQLVKSSITIDEPELVKLINESVSGEMNSGKALMEKVGEGFHSLMIEHHHKKFLGTGNSLFHELRLLFYCKTDEPNDSFCHVGFTYDVKLVSGRVTNTVSYVKQEAEYHGKEIADKIVSSLKWELIGSKNNNSSQNRIRLAADPGLPFYFETNKNFVNFGINQPKVSKQ